MAQSRAKDGEEEGGGRGDEELNTGHIAKEGAMSRRLEQMTEESLKKGLHSAEQTIEEAGFSEELRSKLEERIKSSHFKSDYPTAFTHLQMPVCSSFIASNINQLISDPVERWPRDA